jgi:hypothetical protein
MPFEMLTMRARPDGFELTSTEPVDAESAGKIDSYSMSGYTYIFQADYGSPEVDFTEPKVTSVDVSDDRLRVRLHVDGLKAGNIHELHAAGVRSASGATLLHAEAYYTLNRIPKE